MTERVQRLRRDAEAQIGEATTSEELPELRVRHLGRRAELPQLLRGVAELPPDERASVGRAANEARRAPEGPLARREAELRGGQLDRRRSEERVTVTLPPATAQRNGA